MLERKTYYAYEKKLFDLTPSFQRLQEFQHTSCLQLPNTPDSPPETVTNVCIVNHNGSEVAVPG